jgi:hypothetical protein
VIPTRSIGTQLRNPFARPLAVFQGDVGVMRAVHDQDGTADDVRVRRSPRRLVNNAWATGPAVWACSYRPLTLEIATNAETRSGWRAARRYPADPAKDRGDHGDPGKFERVEQGGEQVSLPLERLQAGQRRFQVAGQRHFQVAGQRRFQVAGQRDEQPPSGR